MASNLRNLSEYVLPRSGPQAKLSVSLSKQAQPPTIQLDTTATASASITVSIRQIQSEKPDTALTIGAIRNIFDVVKILDIGALSLTNVESGERIILHSVEFSPTVRPNFKFSWGRNIRDSMEFVTVPSKNSGEALTLEFDLSVNKLRDLWGRRFMKKSAALEFPFTSPGKWRLHFTSDNSIGFHHDGIVLWSWGALDDELSGKKFEYPVETTYTFDQEAEDTMKAEREGGKYIQLHPDDSSEVECFIAIEADTEGVVVDIID